MSDLEDFKKGRHLIDSVKKLIGEDVSFKSPEKIKISFNKFYYEKFN